MRLVLAVALLFCSGCASMPEMEGDALPLGKTGWRLAGGADFQKQVWFVMFWRPWGDNERNAVAAADKIVLP